MSGVDQIRRAVMNALDEHRGSIESPRVPVSRLDIAIFFNNRTGQPQDVEVRVTSRSDPKRQRDLDADAENRRGVPIALRQPSDAASG